MHTHTHKKAEVGIHLKFEDHSTSFSSCSWMRWFKKFVEHGFEREVYLGVNMFLKFMHSISFFFFAQYIFSMNFLKTPCILYCPKLFEPFFVTQSKDQVESSGSSKATQIPASYTAHRVLEAHKDSIVLSVTWHWPSQERWPSAQVQERLNSSQNPNLVTDTNQYISSFRTRSTKTNGLNFHTSRFKARKKTVIPMTFSHK